MKIVCVTGGRGDWSILSSVLKVLNKDPWFSLNLIITGQHLTEEGKNSLSAVLEAGIPVVEQIDIQLSDNSGTGVAHSTGLAVMELARALEAAQPDMLLILGDRYEILAAATSALLLQIPIIHLCGGDITEGAMDDAIRHAITKMAHVHFVTNEQSRQRLLQMGENPELVYNVGNPVLDLLKQITLINKKELLRTIGLKEADRSILVTCHPVTLDEDPLSDCRALLEALIRIEDSAILFTAANADPGGQKINGLITDFVSRHENAVLVNNLGTSLYFSALASFDVVVGNSSSGIYEAPSFQIPTVNIGDRQKGRLRAKSVLDCPGNADDIRQSIIEALEYDCSDVKNPYGQGDSGQKICSYLKRMENPKALLNKEFFNPETSSVVMTGME